MKPTKKAGGKSLKFVQIVTAQWQAENSDTLNYTVFGLTENGAVYRAMRSDGWAGWEPLDMTGRVKS